MKLLGQGTFGCVTDEFKYTCNKKFNFPIVQKIIGIGMDKYNYKDVLETLKVEDIITEKLLKIKNWKKFFAPAVAGCRLYDRKELLKLNNLQENNNINNEVKQCLQDISMRRFNTFYIQILPKLEGKELIQYYTFKMQPQQFMAFMKHLLVGLNYMHKRDIVHFDIKQENIVWNGSNKFGNFDLCYIDYGLSYILTNLTKEQMIKMQYGTRLFSAPETFLKEGDNLQNSFNNEGKTEIFEMYKIIFNEDELELMFSPKNIKKINSLLSDNTTKEKLQKMTLLKDVYALGICFVELLLKLEKKPEHHIVYDIIKDMISFNFIEKNLPRRMMANELLKKYFK